MRSHAATQRRPPFLARRRDRQYNVPLIRETLAAPMSWRSNERRSQGLLLAAGNPKRIRKIGDLARKGLRIATRQSGAGSHRLFTHLLAQGGVDADALQWFARPAHAETELAAIVRDGHADVGLGIEAAARANGLAFIPLTVERLDLVAFRRDVFEPLLQALLAWTREPAFVAQANALGGYDVAHRRVVFNG